MESSEFQRVQVSPPLTHFMSGEESKVLGKRERDEAQGMDVEQSNGAASEANNGAIVEDDSDDDVGPMPMPMPADGDENGQAVRKKRKGTHNLSASIYLCHPAE